MQTDKMTQDFRVQRPQNKMFRLNEQYTKGQVLFVHTHNVKAGSARSQTRH